jgi:hypothetical protein
MFEAESFGNRISDVAGNRDILCKSTVPPVFAGGDPST